MSYATAPAYDDSEYHDLPPLRERAVSILKKFYKQDEDWEKPPQKLSDDDMYELSRILDKLVKSHSEIHQPTPDMLVHFTQAIFDGWSFHTATSAPPLLDGLRYVAIEYEGSMTQYFRVEGARPRGIDGSVFWMTSTIRFNSETKSFSLYVKTTNADGEEEVRQVSSLENFGGPKIMRKMVNRLRVNIIGELENSSERRAIHYAQYYLHKSKTEGRQQSKLDYKFPQMSMLFAEAPLLLYGEERAPNFFYNDAVPREKQEGT